MNTTTYRSALVIGIGVSGCAAARWLTRLGVPTTVIDSADSPVTQSRAAELQADGATVRVGGELPMDNFDLCVVSPGVAADSAWIHEIRGRGTEIVSELELGARLCPAPMLAITGTNGKSTAVRLCGDVLSAAGYQVALAGNYGPPLIGLAGRTDLDWVVVEVSTFQLEWVRHFSPRVAVLLNIQPDHLDRHGSMEAYRALKWRMFDNICPEHTVVIPREEEPLRSMPEGTIVKRFGGEETADLRLDWRQDVGWRVTDEHGEVVSLRNTHFNNGVLGRTVAAVWAATRACGAERAHVETAVREFEPLPHRMCTVGMHGGVRFVDDSKATNLAALAGALRMSEGSPVRLIAGGRLKENNVATIKEMLAKGVLTVYLIGESAEDLATSWRDVVDCRLCGTLGRAVAEARQEARTGDCVLLSPGCASFDQFASYHERGEVFIRLVNNTKCEAIAS